MGRSGVLDGWAPRGPMLFWGVPYEELMELKETDPAEFKQIRNSMKAVNFGLIYGMGPQTLWGRLLTQNQAVSFQEAQRLHRTWFNTFPKIQNYRDECQRLYRESRTTLPRRVRPL